MREALYLGRTASVKANGVLDWLLNESLPGAALRKLLSYTPTFEGRATRAELVSTFAVVLFVGAVSSLLWSTTPASDAWNFLIPFEILLALLPINSAVVRRLHDVDRYGFAVLVVAFPFVGVLWLLGLLLWDGNPGENEFGPPPCAWRWG